MTIKYAKIINKETKQCEVGIGTNEEFYKSIGMTLEEIEQGYNGNWYLLGYAPIAPTKTLRELKELKLKELKEKRDEYKSTITIKDNITLLDLVVGTNDYENLKNLKYGWLQEDLDLFNSLMDILVNKYILYKSSIIKCTTKKALNNIIINFS